jgi:hypothetical protein
MNVRRPEPISQGPRSSASLRKGAPQTERLRLFLTADTSPTSRQNRPQRQGVNEESRTLAAYAAMP